MSEFKVKEDPCIAGVFPDICTFRFVNGGVLALISLCGTILNLTVIFIVLGRKVRLSNQKIFICNLAISDFLIAVVGLFRGLGIIDPVFVGFVDGKENVWCSAYLLFMLLVSYSNCPCMVALTIDRLVAIVRPFRHRTIFTTKFCIALCVSMWLPQIVFYCWFAISMTTNSSHAFSMDYYANYHRCQNSYKHPWLRTARFASLVWAPFAAIVLMYIIIIYKVIKSGAKSRNLLAISTAVVISGVICWFPSIISSIFSIPMNYKIAQVFTVTLFYVNSSTDPLVFVLLMPAVKEYLVTKLCRCEDPQVPVPLTSLRSVSNFNNSYTTSPLKTMRTVAVISNLKPNTHSASTSTLVGPPRNIAVRSRSAAAVMTFGNRATSKV